MASTWSCVTKRRGDTELAVELLNFQPGLSAQFGVEVRQRLVKQKHLRLAHDCAAHGHTLALATGQFTRLALQQVAQLQEFSPPCRHGP
jgi:hypothetical protein